MQRIKLCLGLLPVVGLSLLVAGCGSSSTGPQATPSAYAGSYKGIFDGAGINGTVAITVGQGASGDLTRGPVLHAEGGANAVTLTLATATGSITLTGTISGNVATVTSTTPPATCTITFTTTGASGSCTEGGQTLSLIAFVLVNGIEATVYCGTQSPGEFPAFFPNATLGAVVSGPNMYLVVAPPTGTPTLYSGTIAGNSVMLTSTSSGGAVYNGTVTGTASIGGTITSGGSWAVANPCVQGALAVSTNAVSATVSVGSTTTITPTPVTITNSGGGGSTLGVLGVGAATYSPSATSGWLQASLTLPTTVSGTLSLSIMPPSGIAAGTYTAAVPITASLGTGSPQTVTVTLTVTTAPQPLKITTTTLPGGSVGAVYNAAGGGTGGGTQLTATGGTLPYTWAVTSGTLPAGLTLSTEGYLLGTPTTANTFTFTVTVTDGTKPTGLTVSQAYTVVITPPAALVITTTSLPPGTVGVAYNDVGVLLAASGGTSPYTWAVTSGTMPPGMTLAAGLVYGTPTTAGMFTFTVMVTDASKPTPQTASQKYTIVIGPALVITTASPLNSAAEGAAYSEQFAATGGTAPYGWTIINSTSVGTPPAGLTLSSGGLLSGTPTVAGTFTFEVRVTDATTPTANTTDKTFTLVVNASSAACTITTTTLGALNLGTYSSIPITYTGTSCPSATNIQWALASGALPTGLTILSALNRIAGTPTGTGPYSFTLEMNSFAPGAVNPVATQAFSGTVGAETACAIGPATVPDGTVGQHFYSQDISASTACTAPADDPSDWGWTLGGSPPPGLSLIPSGGVQVLSLYGTPTTAGTYTFTITFTNTNQVSGHNEASATQSYTMTIAPASGSARVRTTATRARTQ